MKCVINFQFLEKYFTSEFFFVCCVLFYSFWELTEFSTVAITSTSTVYFTYDKPEICVKSQDVALVPQITKGLVSLRAILYFDANYEAQEVTLYLSKEGLYIYWILVMYKL